MGKKTFSILLFLSSCLIAGCGNKSLDLDKIQNNTMMITKDGIISAATVEEFDKPYYTEDGLKVFVEQEVGAYNKINGEDSVVIDSVLVKEGTASLLMTYKSMEHFAGMNHIEAESLTMDNAIGNPNIPTEFIDSSTNKTVSFEEISKNTKLQVVLVNMPMDVIVKGTVKYYSGGVLLNESSVQASDSKICAVVYKP